MTNSAQGSNEAIIEEFRANSGRVGGEWECYTLVLVHHIGFKSGIERVTPLGCFPLDEGRFAVVASNGGSPFHPDWYRNLKANPRVTVELGAETFTALAEELEGTARSQLWPQLAAQSPIGEYQRKIARKIPVLLFTRI
jgi:deazaflavin-dependent oxidoreductase (nitroreductase family)